MASELSKAVYRLHQLLIQLEESEKTLAHGPRRISAAERSVEDARRRIEEQKLEIRAARRKADECSLRLRTREAELLKLQGMLNQASSNKEYDIVKGQLGTATADKSQLEDEALGLMDEVDRCQQTLQKLELELQAREQTRKQVQAEVTAAEPGVRADVERVRSEVEMAEKAIAWGDKQAAYRRLRAAHISDALAAIEDRFCTACQNRVTTQDIVRINTGSLIACRECGRLVYIVDAVAVSE